MIFSKPVHTRVDYLVRSPQVQADSLLVSELGLLRVFQVLQETLYISTLSA